MQYLLLHFVFIGFFSFLPVFYNLLLAQPQLYPVKKNGFWGFMNSNGQLVVPAQYEQVANFQPNGLAIVRKNKLLGAIDSVGKEQISCEYQLLDTVAAFANYWIAEKNKVWRLISNQNQLILDNISGKVAALKNDFFTVENENGLALMHLYKGLIVNYKYHNYQILDNNYFYVQNDSGLFGLISPEGREIIAPIFDNLLYKDGLVFAKKKYRWAVLDTNLNLIYDFIYDYGYLLSEKCLALQPHAAGQLNLYHRDSTNALIENIDSAVLKHQKNAIFVYKWENFGILDLSGKLKISLDYKSVKPHPDNKNFYIAAHQNGNVALLDSNYNLLINSDYQAIIPFSTFQFWRVKQNNMWGVFDIQNNFLPIAPAFAALSKLDYSVALAQIQDSFWVINQQFETVWSNVGVLKDLNLVMNSLSYQNAKHAKQIIQFDSAGSLVDNSNYSNYNKLKVSKKQDLVVIFGSGNINNLNTVQPPVDLGNGLYWVYDNRKKIHKWGIRDSINRRWHYPPTYHQIKVFADIGLTLGSIVTIGETNLEYDKADFTLLGAAALINNQKGLPISQNEFISVKIEDFNNNGNVARCIFLGGEHGLISKSGKIIARGYVYIGKFYEGKARATKRGILRSNLEMGRKQLPVLQLVGNYLQGMDISVEASSLGASNYLDNLYKSDLVCEEAKWGFIDEQGQQVIPFQYDYVSDFHQNSATVYKNNKWGLIDDNNHLLLATKFETMNFLPNSDQNLYQITRTAQKMGAIDTLGKLIVPITYEQVRAKNGFLAVQKQHLWGFINEKGQKICEEQFNNVRDFHENRAAVFERSRWGFIDQNGQLVIKANFANVGDFSQNLAWVRLKNNQMGYIDNTGQIIFQSNFTALTNFVDSVATARDKNMFWGIINQRGEWVCKPNKKFEKIILQPNCSVARAQIGDKYVVIDLHGKILSKPYAVIKEFSENKAVVRRNFSSDNFIKKNDDWGFLDTNGNLIGELKYTKLADFHNNRALFFQNGKGWGYINPVGKEIIPAQFFDAENFNTGRAVVFIKHNQSGLIDTNGTIVMQPKHNKIIAREQNICLVRGGAEHYYYLTEDLKRVFPLVFQDAKTFRHHVAAVKKSNFWGLVNMQGLWLISPKYQQMSEFKNEFASVSISTRYGIANTKGEIIIPPDYEYVEFVGNNLFRVENGDFIGYLNIKGEWIWAMNK
jgi:WG containing repeat